MCGGLADCREANTGFPKPGPELSEAAIEKVFRLDLSPTKQLCGFSGVISYKLHPDCVSAGERQLHKGLRYLLDELRYFG